MLHPNYPNPFHTSTVISFTKALEDHVQLSIYNERNGTTVELLNQRMPAGKHQLNWQPDDWAIGIYLLQIKSGNVIETQRLLLVK